MNSYAGFEQRLTGWKSLARSNIGQAPAHGAQARIAVETERCVGLTVIGPRKSDSAQGKDGPGKRGTAREAPILGTDRDGMLICLRKSADAPSLFSPA